MARTIYAKPTRALLKDMLNDLGLQPGQVFASARAIAWFKEHYPKLRPTTIPRKANSAFDDAIYEALLN